MMPRRFTVGILWLLLVFAPRVRMQGEVVLRIGDRDTVTVEEYVYYRQKWPKLSDADFLRRLIDFKLKVVRACEWGMDTLPSFRMQLAACQGRIERDLRADRTVGEQEARRLYERGQQRLRMTDWVKVAHISKYLPQHVERREEIAAQELMDSLYAALKAGADFAELARRYSDDEESRSSGGQMPWMPVQRSLQEWTERFASLDRDVPSLPFYSPLGLHIVKWTDRKPAMTYEEKRADLLDYVERSSAVAGELTPDERRIGDLRCREVHDALLAACLTLRSGPTEAAPQPAELEAFFRQHRADYVWDLPHFRGAVVRCKDKKAASALRKFLRGLPYAEWEGALKRLAADVDAPRFVGETGVYRIGQHAVVDKLAFKCGRFEPDPDYPYTFVVGKKLKKGPESHEDVSGEVARDYRSVHQEAWIKDLRASYKVEINEEVLKTVNYGGSN